MTMNETERMAARTADLVTAAVLSASNFYTLLNVSRDASKATIKRSYKQLARVVHPDKNSAPLAHTAFLRLKTAAETLLDPSKRCLYDFENFEMTTTPREHMHFPRYRSSTGNFHEMLFSKQLLIIYIVCVLGLYLCWPIENITEISMVKTEALSFECYTRNLNLPYFVHRRHRQKMAGDKQLLIETEKRVEKMWHTHFKEACHMALWARRTAEEEAVKNVTNRIDKYYAYLETGIDKACKKLLLFKKPSLYYEKYPFKRQSNSYAELIEAALSH